jgi:hypothetical protein
MNKVRPSFRSAAPEPSSPNRHIRRSRIRERSIRSAVSNALTLDSAWHACTPPAPIPKAVAAIKRHSGSAISWQQDAQRADQQEIIFDLDADVVTTRDIYPEPRFAHVGVDSIQLRDASENSLPATGHVFDLLNVFSKRYAVASPYRVHAGRDDSTLLALALANLREVILKRIIHLPLPEAA